MPTWQILVVAALFGLSGALFLLGLRTSGRIRPGRSLALPTLSLPALWTGAPSRRDEALDVDLARQIRLGFVLVAALGVLVLGWGAIAQIAGAVVAPGRVALESSVKRIQHKEGGIVSDLLVKEGDQVRAGALLARIDSTGPQAKLAVVSNQFDELTVRRMRLEAERDGRTSLALSPDELSRPGLAALVGAEQRLMTERYSLKSQKKAQLQEQIGQSQEEITGLRAQVASLAGQRQLIDGELEGVRELRAKGLATLPRLNALEREARQLDGSRAQAVAAIAQARAKIAEVQVQALQVDSQDLAQVMEELKDTESKLAQLAEQKTTGEDELRRVELRAPVDGKVQQLAIHTKGGVVAPGETLMLIVPDRDELIVEARIDPGHIDQVSPGREAKIRFTSFQAATTPVLNGKVDRLADDVETDERTGARFYLARLKIDQTALPASIRSRLVAGMPAEVQIRTESRNALSYFLKPLSDQLERTFRED